MTPRREDDVASSLLRAMIEQNDEKHEQAHRRLRLDIRSLESRMEATERLQATLAGTLDHLAKTPPDATNLRVPLPMVATIVGGFLILGAGMWSFRSDVLARLDNAKAESINSAKLQDAQYQSLKDTIKTLDQQQRLQYAEFQTFRQEMARKR